MRILIADDHILLRQGLQSKIQSHLPQAKLFFASSHAEVHERLKDDVYDLLITDLKMEHVNPLYGVSRSLEVRQEQKILVLTMYPAEIFAVRLLKMGVKGYVSKESSSDELILAIKDVLEGKTYCDRQMINKLIGYVASESESSIDSLTDRELEIMLLLVHGYAPKEISQKLHIHTSTIGTYRHRIYSKLHMNNLVELTLFAIQHHLI